MKLSKITKAFLIVLSIFLVFIFGVSASDNNRYDSSAKEVIDKFSPSEIGQSLKQKISLDRDKPMAYINGVAINKSEFELKKYRNELNYKYLAELYKDDEEKLDLYRVQYIKSDIDILTDIAKIKLVFIEAEKNGIVVSDQEILGEMEATTRKLQELAGRGDIQAVWEKKLNDEFLKNIGLSMEEYQKTIGLKIQKEIKVVSEYKLFYCRNLAEKNNFDITAIPENNFESHLNSLFDSSNFVLVS